MTHIDRRSDAVRTCVLLVCYTCMTERQFVCVNPRRNDMLLPRCGADITICICNCRSRGTRRTKTEAYRPSAVDIYQVSCHSWRLRKIICSAVQWIVITPDPSTKACQSQQPSRCLRVSNPLVQFS